jgi:hypothetical protein
MTREDLLRDLIGLRAMAVESKLLSGAYLKLLDKIIYHVRYRIARAS